MPLCFVCGYSKSKDNTELAQHIVDQKKTHRKSLRWASSFLLRVRQLNQKRDMPQRMPIPEEQREAIREAREALKMVLSGEMVSVMTVCPGCRGNSIQRVEIEFAQSPYAWRGQQGTLVMRCQSCS